MSKITTKLVTNNRLRQLIDCYGSESTCWPENERQAALSLLKGSPELRHYRDDARRLDTILEQLKVQENNTINTDATQSLQQRIMHGLPEQQSTSSKDYVDEQPATENTVTVQHTGSSRFWIGSIAASLFIISLSAGIIHQLMSPGQKIVNPPNNTLQVDNEFAQWAWEDITGESLVEETDNDPGTLLAMVELELPVE